ncbi:MAG: hypothetical protein P8J27_01535 [Mariniblastus sp.]|nr:hypothetical protein [Mariniblastus sp.]
MHANQLAELGSWVAINAGTLIYGENEQPMMVATNYWTASKIRINRWITALKMFEQDFNSPIKNHDPWPAMAILIQEILFSEMLTRVWAATVTTHDWYHNSDEMHGLAHSVHISHIEAKNRAIRVMLHGRSTNEKMFDQLNSSRRRMERWTDLFLGQLPSSEQAALFAFDRNRVRDFINENQETAGQEFVTRQKVLMLSFAADMLRDKIDYSANPEINREIAAGILSCFPADRFDSYGLPKSVRSVWLEKSQTDTQMLVDHLFEFDNKSLSKPTPSPPPPYTQVKRNISL